MHCIDTFDQLLSRPVFSGTARSFHMHTKLPPDPHIWKAILHSYLTQIMDFAIKFQESQMVFSNRGKCEIHSNPIVNCFDGLSTLEWYSAFIPNHSEVRKAVFRVVCQ